jgi:peptide/nickel transport system substrate-binding protein
VKKAVWLVVAMALVWLCASILPKRSGSAGVLPEVHTATGDSPSAGGELRFCLRSDPKSFHPLLISDEPEEIVAYLTAGVLIRVNRLTQQFEPELAESWKVLEGGRRINFQLRSGVRFSDGVPLRAEDVAFTLRSILDPKLHSPAGDPFRSPKGSLDVRVSGPGQVDVKFPVPVAGVERLFDQVPIVSARALAEVSRPDHMPVLGPYRIAAYKPGSYVLLARNPAYWKKDARGLPLPYIDSIRLFIQENREMELLRFNRGELDLIEGLDPESFERLAQQHPAEAVDGGASLEGEQLWFNQVASAPIAPYRKEWFRSREFRQAVSQAMNRADIARVVYRNRAAPALGPLSPANRVWFDTDLKPTAYDPAAALAKLAGLGFRLDASVLRDRSGNTVEFSLITNSGNKMRERAASLVQQDLSHIGIRLNVVTLDFASLIERITRTFNYEACMLGLVNVDIDPSAQMNIWLSSAANHPWNPSERVPQTAWEAEIDQLMLAQAAEISATRRKALVDRLQLIVRAEAPVLYVVDKHALSAVSSSLGNVSVAALHPQTFWNIEHLYFHNRRKEARR